MKRETTNSKAKKVSRFFFFPVLVLIAGLVFIYSGAAQDLLTSQTLEVSPPSQEIQADPGTTITVKAVLRNRSKETLPIKARVEDFTASGEEGQVALVEKSSYSLTGWTSVSPSSFTLNPGESREVKATISVPKNAAGGRYGSFVFSIQPTTPTGQTAAKVAQEIGSLFLVRISGPVNESLSLSEFAAPRFSEFGPIDFSLKFRNSGNVHVKTSGLINISNAFNKKVKDVVIKPTNIFPGSDRIIKATLDKRFLLGPYTATAIVYYGDKNEVIVANANFFVLPVRIIAIALIILFLIFALRKRLGKAFKVLFKG